MTREFPLEQTRGSTSETASEGDGNELRADTLGRCVMVAAFDIETIRSGAGPESNATAHVSSRNNGGGLCQRLACVYGPGGAGESPPQPGRGARRSGCTRDRRREDGVADVQATASNEVGAKQPAAQLEAVVAGHHIDVTGPIEIAGLERLERLACRINPVPHELADERVTLVKVVARSRGCSPARTGHLARCVKRLVDDHADVAVDSAFVFAVVILCAKRGEPGQHDQCYLQSNLYAMPHSRQRRVAVLVLWMHQLESEMSARLWNGWRGALWS